MSPSRNFSYGEQFHEIHEVELRSQILELKRSHSTRIDQSRSSLSPIQQFSSSISNVTTVLTYPWKYDIQVISRWTSVEIDVFNYFWIFQLPIHDAWQIVTHSFPQTTLETLRGIINMARYEQRQPGIPLKEMTIQYVINTLRWLKLRIKIRLTTLRTLLRETCLKWPDFLFRIAWMKQTSWDQK